MMSTPSFYFYYNSSGIAWNPGYLIITSPPSTVHLPLSSPSTAIKRFLSNKSTILSSLLLPLTVKVKSSSQVPSSSLKLTGKPFTSSTLQLLLLLPSSPPPSTLPPSSLSVETTSSSTKFYRGEKEGYYHHLHHRHNHHHHHQHHQSHHSHRHHQQPHLLGTSSNISHLPTEPMMADTGYSSVSAAATSLAAAAAAAASSALTSSVSSSLPGSSGSSATGATPSILNTVNSFGSGDPGYGSPGSDTLVTWQDVTILLLKIISCGSIILMAIFGNLLIIISVYRHQRLRITTNYFVVSLACADILVALFAMTFKASVAITGKWFLGKLVCDFWNSCDVLFSTASIMHLCCISVDRYYAIIKPLDYPMKITNRAVAIMLAVVWISSTLISFVPIFTGLYTTSEHMNYQQKHPEECSFKVNLPYSLISSSVSFWIPCTVMLFTYWRIYVEATKQEKMLYKHTQMIPKVQQTHHHHHKQHHHTSHHHTSSSSSHSQQQQQQQLTNYSTGPSVGGGGTTNNNNTANNKDNNNVTSGSITTPCATNTPTTTTTTTTTITTLTNDTGNGSSSSGSHITVHAPPHRNSHGDDTESGQSTPTKRCINKMKREHKAAKTLGIIMGAFIACWLPFFVTYVTLSVCGDSCVDFPDIVVDTLFWVGYFNSAINPVIYAYFNREFREAFKETIQNVFCCCLQVECLQGPRNNSAIHFNCTYRSTQDIGLVENKYVKD